MIDNDIIYVGQYNSLHLSSNQYTITNHGHFDAFCVRFDKNQSTNWLIGFGGAYYDTANSIAIHNNNLYVSGIFTTSAYFADKYLNEPNGFGYYVTKLCHNGSLEWVIQATTYSWNQNFKSYALSNDLVVSIAYKAVNPGIFEFGDLSEIINPQTIYNTFLARFDENSAVRWIKHIAGHDVGAIVYCIKGNYIAGVYDSTTALVNFTMPHVDSVAPFVARINLENGAFEWMIRGYDDGHNYPRAIEVFDDRIIVVGDYLTDMVRFGTHQVYYPHQYSNVFIACLDHNGTVLWLNTVNSGDSVTVTSIRDQFISGQYTTASYFDDIEITGSDNFYLALMNYGGNFTNVLNSYGPGSEVVTNVHNGDHTYLSGFYYSDHMRFDGNTLPYVSSVNTFMVQIEDIIGDNSECNDNGEMINNQCECYDGYFGASCLLVIPNITNSSILNVTNSSILNNTNSSILNVTNTSSFDDTNSSILNVTNSSILNVTNSSILNVTNTSSFDDTNSSILNITTQNITNATISNVSKTFDEMTLEEKCRNTQTIADVVQERCDCDLTIKDDCGRYEVACPGDPDCVETMNEIKKCDDYKYNAYERSAKKEIIEWFRNRADPDCNSYEFDTAWRNTVPIITLIISPIIYLNEM